MTSYPLAIRRPKLVLMLWGLVFFGTAFVIAVFPKMRLDPSVRSLINRDDPDLAFDRTAKEKLSDDELIVVAIGAPRSVFDVPTLTYLDHLTTQIEKLPHIRKVYSLTRADNIRGRGGTLVADDLITELPKTQEDLARIVRETFENPIYPNTLVSTDQRAASINIEMKAGHGTVEDAETSDRLFEIIEQAEPLKPADVETHVTGFAIASHIGGTYMLEDQLRFSAGAAAVLAIIMFFVLRCWQGVAFTMAVSFVGVQVVYGVLVLAGFAVTMPLSSMSAFMTAIGMEYSVYVAFAYMHAAETGPPGSDRSAVLAESLRDVRFTVIMSAACTAAAFASITTSPIGDLKVLGVLMCIGTLVCCIAAITIIPAFVTLFGFPIRTPERRTHQRLQRLIDRIGHLDCHRPYRVLAALLIIVAIGAVLISRTQTDVEPFQYFRKSSQIRIAHDFVTEHMAGDGMLPAVIVANDVDTFKDPENLRKLDEIARYAAGLPHVTKVLSHADHIKLMNQALVSGAPADFKLPSSRQAVEQFLLLHNQPDDFHAWIDSDYRIAGVTIRMDTSSSTVLADNERLLEAYMKQQFPAFDARAVGTANLAGRSLDVTSMSLVTGILTAAVLIWIIMVIGFRSIRIGSLALIPTLPPALMVYATLPVIGHSLDPPTSITGVIALGIAIDDTTWFLSTWVTQRRKTDNVNAVKQTLSAIGRPMVLSSMVLGSGFMIMLLSKYLVLFWSGIMMVLVAFWSIFFDVLCTPTLVRLLDPKLPQRRLSFEGEENKKVD
jgi:uncharacterized protein